ncbi:OLC1v1022384C1 [Oldenlandia corymbosa var. corymbosa]|uniref:OLC1v1022384C1 n=1 Tax=Oldenlandia corymbosa var. corymbosa TaxID=529605 RepID=A0AAV1C0J2_OLDCO|nr:OLC1v1022384C1 [Oldenlandia corymbosa var. corymbosa]
MNSTERSHSMAMFSLALVLMLIFHAEQTAAQSAGESRDSCSADCDANWVGCEDGSSSSPSDDFSDCLIQKLYCYESCGSPDPNPEDCCNWNDTVCNQEEAAIPPCYVRKL